MTKPMVRIHNSETGEIIDREMNAAEFKQHEIDLAAFDKANADAQAASAAKAAILNRLGITAEEALLLLS